MNCSVLFAIRTLHCVARNTACFSPRFDSHQQRGLAVTRRLLLREGFGCLERAAPLYVMGAAESTPAQQPKAVAEASDRKTMKIHHKVEVRVYAFIATACWSPLAACARMCFATRRAGLDANCQGAIMHTLGVDACVVCRLCGLVSSQVCCV